MIQRRNFTREFKLSILNELESKPVAQLCREHNLHPTAIYKWKKEHETNPHEAFAGKGKVWKEDAKIAQYERLIGRLYAEIDFLKKTLETLQRRKAEEKGRRWSS